MASSIFPDGSSAAGTVIRDAEGDCTLPEGVHNAYCPPATYASTCEITALPSDCNARIEPRQINAIVSELVAFAECLDPDGPWDCGKLNNLCASFVAWYAAHKGVIYTGDEPPTTPVEGSIWWDENDQKLYIYQDGAWVLVSNAAIDKSIIYIGDDPPAAATPDNSLWWSSEDGILYVKYNDGSSSQWVVASPIPDVDQFVLKTGGSMTGPLVLSGNPTDMNGAATKQYVDTVASAQATVRSYLAGLGLSTAGSSTTFTVAAGVAANSTNAVMMTLAASLAKTTAAWTVGAAGGSFDGTGAAPSATAGWYHVHLIRRPDTGVVDILTSLSAAAPTLPANYTQFRRIGSMKTSGSFQWVAFSQQGDEFLWAVSLLDISTTTLGTTPQNFAMTVPPGVIVDAKLRGHVAHGTIGTAVIIYCPAIPAAVPNVPVGNMNGRAMVLGNGNPFGDIAVRTNTSAQVAAVSSAASTTVSAVTFGWIDRRGKDD